MEELKTLYKSVFGEELSEEEIKKAGELPADALNAVKSAVKTLEKYKEDFEDDLKAALKTLTKYSSYGYPAKKSDEEANKELLAELTDVAKAGARLSKATRDELQKIADIIQGMLKTDSDADVKKDDIANLTPEQQKEFLRLRGIEAGVKKSAQDAADSKEREEFKKNLEKELEEKYGLKKKVEKSHLDPDDLDPDPEPKPKGSEEYQKRLAKSGRKSLWPSIVGGDSEN